jgi:hypothetical protein
MKPIAISSYLAFAAFSLYAADPQAAKESPTPQPVKHNQVVLSQQQTATAGGDSPLVRAAKAASHPLRKSSSPVITNETLVRDGGHFTTTSSQPPIPAGNSRSTELTFEQMAADVRRARAEAAATAEQYRKTEEQKKYAAAINALRAEGDTPEGLYDDSPGGGGAIQTVKPTTLPTAPTKPPQ